MRASNLSRPIITLFLIVCLMAGSPRMASSQPGPASDMPPGGDPWPRKLTTQGAKIQIYQPQLDRWAGDTLAPRPPCRDRTYGHWGNTAYAGTRAAWANPYTGNIAGGARGV